MYALQEAGTPVGNPSSQNGDAQFAAANPQDTTATGTLGWLFPNLGNYTLIAIGIILGIGALLISQKETVVQVASTAAKAAA